MDGRFDPKPKRRKISVKAVVSMKVPWLLVPMFILTINHQGWAFAMTFNVFPTTLNQTGDVVTITWKDISLPNKLDWIGVYSPPYSDDEHYIGYVLLSSCSGWYQGSCTLNMSLMNMREAYQLRLFRGETVNTTKDIPTNHDFTPVPNTTHRLAVSPNIVFSNWNEPTQIHLSLTSVSTEMRVMFVTRDAVKSYVKYGLKRDDLSYTHQTFKGTYQQSDMCHAPANHSLAWRNPGYIHDVVMDNLDPGRLYFYQVGSDEGGWSEVHSFTSMDYKNDETNALLFGDLGTSPPYTTITRTQPESLNTVKWLRRDLNELRGKPVFISHIGDISYARGYAWLWDSFFTQIEPMASEAPYHVCIGNHEYDWPSQPWMPSWAEDVFRTDGGGECGIPYSMRFHMPGNSTFPTGVGSLPTKNLYYSLDVGIVHFVYFSTETNFLNGSPQYTFLVEDLKSVDRYKTPYIVFLGHRPMYSSDGFSDKETIFVSHIREHLEPILVENKVNLALWGHVHKYERTCAIHNFTCADADSREILPVHVVIGMGGADWQPHDRPMPEHEDLPIYPQPVWSRFRSSEFGYTRLHASRSTLTLSYIGNHDGEIHDVVEISSTFATPALSKTCDTGDWSCNWFMFLAVGVASIGFLLTLAVVSYFIRTKLVRRRWEPIQSSEPEL